MSEENFERFRLYDLQKLDDMVQMDLNSLKQRDLALDLESATVAMLSEEDSSCNESNIFDCGSNGANSAEGPSESKPKDGVEKTKKKKCKKPPKPPRPPRPPSVDANDQKLIREINELAMLKRARAERMKALKRMKNAKTVPSGVNWVPWIIMLIFCAVIIWQGIFSRGSSSLGFHGSPESSVGARGGFISVQFYNASAGHDSSSASPNNVEQLSGLDNHGEGSRAAG